MSMPKKSTVACINCGHAFETTTWQSINTGYNDTVAEDIMSGKFFKGTCPECNTDFNLAYDILYHDMRNGAMIYLMHPGEEDFEERLNDLDDALIPHDYTTRVVHDINRLKEKVSALEAGRDDRVIELAKWFFAQEVFEKYPDFKLTDVFYAYIHGDEIFFFYDKDGNTLNTVLNDKFYDIIARNFEDDLKEPQKPWQIIDAAWARPYIIK